MTEAALILANNRANAGNGFWHDWVASSGKLDGKPHGVFRLAGDTDDAQHANMIVCELGRQLVYFTGFYRVEMPAERTRLITIHRLQLLNLG